jgi:hypothetical protein
MVGKLERECCVSNPIIAAILVLACFFLHVTLVCSYEALAQNGFTNIPKQLKIDEGYYGKGFYFTRFPRSNDDLHLRCVVADADPTLPQVQRLLQLRVFPGDA